MTPELIEYLISAFGMTIFLAVIVALGVYKLIEKLIYARLSARIRELEHSAQQLLVDIEGYHAISRNSLEKAFEKKVQVYESLLSARNDWFKFVNENPVHEEPDSEETLLGYFEAVIELIQTNLLYISSDLAGLYEAWYKAAQPHIHESNYTQYEVWQQSFGTDADREKAYYAGIGSKFKMMKATTNEFNAMLSCIDQDIRDIRTSLERPMGIKSRQLNPQNGLMHAG